MTESILNAPFGAYPLITAVFPFAFFTVRMKLLSFAVSSGRGSFAFISEIRQDLENLKEALRSSLICSWLSFLTIWKPTEVMCFSDVLYDSANGLFVMPFVSTEIFNPHVDPLFPLEALSKS